MAEPITTALIVGLAAQKFVEDEEFEASLKDLAQQIIQIQNQSQMQSNNTFTSNDSSTMRAVGQVYGTANLGDQK
jgi:hypothetical protein